MHWVLVFDIALIQVEGVPCAATPPVSPTENRANSSGFTTPLTRIANEGIVKSRTSH